MMALSIRQPWAWLVVTGAKTVEFRSWSTDYRGPLLIHAGATVDKLSLDDLRLDGIAPLTIDTGGFIGICDLVDVTDAEDYDDDPDAYRWLVRNPRPLPFVAAKGKLRLFSVDSRTLRRLGL